MGEVGLCEVFVGEHGDEHRRNAVEAGDLFIVDAGKGRFRREIRHRAERTAVGHQVRHRKHHAEAVEHRHLDHHAVCGGNIHAVADEKNGFAEYATLFELYGKKLKVNEEVYEV